MQENSQYVNNRNVSSSQPAAARFLAEWFRFWATEIAVKSESLATKQLAKIAK
jgi:hypothetical protein